MNPTITSLKLNGLIQRIMIKKKGIAKIRDGRNVAAAPAKNIILNMVDFDSSF